MTKNKWDVQPFPEAAKVEEIASSLSESLADPGTVIIPVARTSIAEIDLTEYIETIKDESNSSPKVYPEDDGWNNKPISAEFYSNKNRVEDLILKISKELNIAHSRKYDAVQAELTAALILEAQRELSEFLSDAELISKEKKAEVERVEAEQYFFYKNSEKQKEDGKVTDTALTKMVAKDKLVLAAKSEQYQAEADFSKYKNLFGMLKDAHIFFRSIGKGKNDWT